MLLGVLSNTETYSFEKIMVIYFSQFVFCAIDISKKVGNFENVFMFLTIFETQPFSGEQFTRLTSIQHNFARRSFKTVAQWKNIKFMEMPRLDVTGPRKWKNSFLKIKFRRTTVFILDGTWQPMEASRWTQSYLIVYTFRGCVRTRSQAALVPF